MRTPALTLWRPWPACFTDLPAHAAKRVENRTWNTAHRGDVYLHAGQRFDHDAFRTIGPIERTIRGEDLGDVHVCYTPDAHWISRNPAEHPTGIVAVAELVDVCTRSRHGHPCDCGPWAVPGQCHWRFANIRKLATPIPCPGAQQLWWPTPAIVAAVTANLELDELVSDPHRPHW